MKKKKIDSLVNQHRISELAVLYADSDGITLSADKKQTVEKKRNMQKKYKD